MLRLAIGLAITLAGCAKSDGPGRETAVPKTPEANRTTADGIPIQGYEIVNEYPHDAKAYTQGLLIVDGVLYESTGRLGESSVRIVDLETGEPLKVRPISSRLFGEGLAAVGGVLYQVTWKAGRALVFDRETLRPLEYEYRYDGEGWGLTTSPEGLVLSDGTTDTIQFLDPKGFKVTRTIQVTDAGRPVYDLNELEWINGEIWANVWKSDRVARIDPATGKVLAWIDFRGLLGGARLGSPQEDVLNGIAFDEATGNIYVTGKRWPKLFQVRIVE